METKSKKLNILFITSTESKYINELEEAISKYFKVNVEIDDPKNIKNHLSAPIDILIINNNDRIVFKNEYYHRFKSNNSHFKYINVKRNVEEGDYEIYKSLTDDILYIDDIRIAKWKMIAILRRYWDTFSKSTTEIYKGVIADFVDGKVSVNDKKVDLTKKELKLLKMLMNNAGEFVSRMSIYMKVWGHEDESQRSLDQMIFKLKKKIGKEFFHTSRSKGYKFE